MKVLFVGLGSIGSRHLKLLKELVHFQALSFRNYVISQCHITEAEMIPADEAWINIG
jgi:hypothetical protein